MRGTLEHTGKQKLRPQTSTVEGLFYYSCAFPSTEVEGRDGHSPLALAALQGTDTPDFHFHFIGQYSSHGFNLTAREAGKYRQTRDCLGAFKGEHFVFLAHGIRPLEGLWPNHLSSGAVLYTLTGRQHLPLPLTL